MDLEATEREVREVRGVFRTFSELKLSVRLSKKVTGSHMEFAFIKFQVR